MFYQELGTAQSSSTIPCISSLFFAVVVAISIALCLLFGNSLGGYLICMFIAFSFVPMISAFCYYSSAEKKVAGYTAMLFSAIYAVFILVVYFAQIKAVVNDGLNEQALLIIDFQLFGLFFSYDLLG